MGLEIFSEFILYIVRVYFPQEHLEAKKPEWFSTNFDVVIVTNHTRDVMVKVNKITRDSGIKFFAGDIFGFFGYCFLDLVKHEYVEEVKGGSEMFLLS